MPPRTPELAAKRDAIGMEIAGLLQQGRVLKTSDVREIALTHGFTSKIVPRDFFGEWVGSYPEHTRYEIAGLVTIPEKVLGILIIRSAGLPIEQTDFDRVKEEIRKERMLRNPNRSTRAPVVGELRTQGLTFADIASKMGGISRQRAHQLHKQFRKLEGVGGPGFEPGTDCV